MSEARFWLIVASKNHVMTGLRSGIAQANHGKPAALKRMRVGDGLVYYSPKLEFEGTEKLQAFTAIGRVTGQDVYQFDMGGGFVPFRRDVQYFECRDLPIQEVLPDLTFIENKQSWGYVFRFGFLEIPKLDYDLISKHMLLANGD